MVRHIFQQTKQDQLYMACLDGKVPVVRSLLAEGVRAEAPTARVGRGCHCIVVAAERKFASIVAMLLDDRDSPGFEDAVETAKLYVRRQFYLEDAGQRDLKQYRKIYNLLTVQSARHYPKFVSAVNQCSAANLQYCLLSVLERYAAFRRNAAEKSVFPSVKKLYLHKANAADSLIRALRNPDEGLQHLSSIDKRQLKDGLLHRLYKVFTMRQLTCPIVRNASARQPVSRALNP